MDQDAFMHRIILWRRKKRILLILLIISMLLSIFGLQYLFINEKGQFDSDFIDRNEDGAFMRSIKVKFIEAAKLTSQDEGRKKHVRREGLGEIVRIRTEKPLEETQEVLGIPFYLSELQKPYIPKQRIVHFDLKGAPPTVNYLKKVITLTKTVGATGILIEYEDMFPYTGILANVSAKNAYTVEQINDILKYAEEMQLEVIPLIQTFGHMEYALKHQSFAKLREVPGSPQALCPSRNGSLDFVRETIHQVLIAHPTIKYLHIGCDEVFEMGECEICRSEIRENLFLKHVQNVAKLVHDKNPNIQVIVWDDMLRHISVQVLQAANIGDHVEPMIWVYAEDIYRFVQPPTWDKYAAIFKTAWTASAFKGAFGETLYIPNAKRHLENNLRWLEVMSTQSLGFKHGLRGIVLTGWQRYDHFAILCELLPGAIPSLILNLLATSSGYFNATQKEQFLNSLSCPNPIDRRPSPFLNLDSDPNMWEKLSRCLFPGNGFFKVLYRLNHLEQQAKEYIDSTTWQKGWMTEYNVRHNFSSVLRVDELTLDLARVYHGMISLARSASEALIDVVDNFTISEWIEQRIYPYLVRLEQIQNDSLALKSQKYWPARPLPILKDLQRHGIDVE